MGDNLVPLTIGLAVAGTLLLRLTGSAEGRAGHAGAVGGPLRRATVGLAGLVTVAAVTAGAMTVVVGHSGAEAAWTGTLEEARRPPATAATAPAVITLADVAQRGTPDACWTVVDGVVYDLTGFIARHPAGSDAILEMCGRDATEDYRDEHEGQPEPAEWLAVFRIGDLATG